ncbi:MAG: hypothetical protein ACI95K_002252, partial [Lentimonas sp.]
MKVKDNHLLSPYYELLTGEDLAVFFNYFKNINEQN